MHLVNRNAWVAAIACVTMVSAFILSGSFSLADAHDNKQKVITITNADLPRFPEVSVVGGLLINGKPASERELPPAVMADATTSQQQARQRRMRRLALRQITPPQPPPRLMTVSGDTRTLRETWQPQMFDYFIYGAGSLTATGLRRGLSQY